MMFTSKKVLNGRLRKYLLILRLPYYSIQIEVLLFRR